MKDNTPVVVCTTCGKTHGRIDTAYRCYTIAERRATPPVQRLRWKATHDLTEQDRNGLRQLVADGATIGDAADVLETTDDAAEWVIRQAGGANWLRKRAVQQAGVA